MHKWLAVRKLGDRRWERQHFPPQLALRLLPAPSLDPMVWVWTGAELPDKRGRPPLQLLVQQWLCAGHQQIQCPHSGPRASPSAGITPLRAALHQGWMTSCVHDHGQVARLHSLCGACYAWAHLPCPPSAQQDALMARVHTANHLLLVWSPVGSLSVVPQKPD